MVESEATGVGFDSGEGACGRAASRDGAFLLRVVENSVTFTFARGGPNVTSIFEFYKKEKKDVCLLFICRTFISALIDRSNHLPCLK